MEAHSEPGRRCPKTLPPRGPQIADSTAVRFADIAAHKQMFMGLLELVSRFRQKHCECSEECYRLHLQCVDCEMVFEGGSGDPNELLLAKMSFNSKYHRAPTGSRASIYSQPCS